MTLGFLATLIVALLAAAASVMRSTYPQAAAVNQCSARSIGDE